jgi:hypothetical protein
MGGDNDGKNWVNNLEITVSGASVGNGNFIFSDFDQVSFNSASVVFDLSEELVGQGDIDWGTCSNGCGDFNLFSASNADSPTGYFANVLATDAGDGDRMALAAFTPTVVSEPSTLALFALGVMGLASRRFKKKS